MGELWEVDELARELSDGRKRCREHMLTGDELWEIDGLARGLSENESVASSTCLPGMSYGR